MDFEALLSILLVILYFVFQLAGRKKSRNKQRRPQPQHVPAPQRVETPGARETEWERALREIRAALEEPKPEPRKQRQPAPPAPERPTPAKRRTAVSEMQERFSEPERFSETAYDEVFEAGPGDRPVIEQRSNSLRTRPAAAPAPSPVTTAARSTASSPEAVTQTRISGLLRQPDAARNAILLGEILGPPRSKRPA